MKKIIIFILTVLCVLSVFGAMPTFASTSENIEVTGADILRGARSNVNRELMSVNTQVDGVTVRSVFEVPSKAIAKVAIKKGVAFSENFSIKTDILSADSGVTMDIGFIYGDVDEGWLDPWDFLGIDMNDAGSVAKFKNIGGFTVRFSLTTASSPVLMMKGYGENLSDAAFALAGITSQVPFIKERDVAFVKVDGNWQIKSGDAVLPFEANANKVNPSGSENAQTFINKVLDAALGKNVYAFIAMEGSQNNSSAAVKITNIGGKNVTTPRTSDSLLGDVSYDATPDKSIEFSLIENYYLGFEEYSNVNFTYLSQAYMNPSFSLTEKGLKISGRDKLYGVNGDLTYLKPCEKFDGYTAVLSMGDMPKSSSTINSNISLTLNGQAFASYYAWNSVYIKITFPYEDFTKGYNATVYLWGERTSTNVLVAEMPISHIPYVEGGDIVIKIAKIGDNHYIYVNGVRFGDGYETALNSTISKIETGYTDSTGLHKGFYANVMNTTAYLSTGLGLSDFEVSKTPSVYVKQLGGATIQNEVPVLKSAQRPYLPDDSGVTNNSIKISFSSELPDRTDGNFTIDGYVIERYQGNQLKGTFKVVGENNRTFTDTNLSEDTRYTYHVYAVQGVNTDNPIKLVAYQPITVKTLKVIETTSILGMMSTIFTILGITVLLVAIFVAIYRLRIRKDKSQNTQKVYAPRVFALGKVKPLSIILSIVIFMGALSGCSAKKPNEPDKNPPDESVFETMIDTFENLTTPAWESGVMYNETVLMIKGADGAISGKLAFAPIEVISVRNYTLDKTYSNGVDYNIDENGKITLTENSACPYLLEENFIYSTRPQGVEGLYEFPSASSSKPNLMYTETSFLVEKQICVTYKYDKTNIADGIFSTADENKLPSLRSKLSNKSNIRLAVLGDSISQGANSSGFLGIEPYQPTYSSLFRQYLEKTFAVNVIFENFSLGGQKSDWGASRAYAVGQFMPDVVILSFGANDGGVGVDNTATPVSVQQFTQNMQAAMDNVRKYNPNCEFILVSSLVPNPKGAAYGIQGEYADAIDNMVANNNSAVSVDMYHVHEYFLNVCGKNYADMSSNYINHPNDFLIRLYTQNIISALW